MKFSGYIKNDCLKKGILMPFFTNGNKIINFDLFKPCIKDLVYISDLDVYVGDDSIVVIKNDDEYIHGSYKSLILDKK